MDETEFLDAVSDKILDGADITMGTLLKDIEAWDSLSIVSFLALMDVTFGKNINPLEAKTAKTIGDLYALVK